MIEPRRLEEICKLLEPEDFHMELLSNYYCKLKPHENIDCCYRSEEPDDNKLYVCNKYNKIYNGEYE